MTALKNATREHHHLIRAAKRNFFTDRLDKNRHNSRELFSIVKEFSNPSANANANTVTPSQDLCESLATFFHRKISDLHDSFGHQTQPNTTEPASTAITLNNWSHINTEETKSIMNSIHSGAPSDPCPHLTKPTTSSPRTSRPSSTLLFLLLPSLNAGNTPKSTPY
ncbi:hypothetical protein NDU88_003705 [Pleurodeles waltl]|uniref:Uncharacterized protein n=1 Tax=Pleurodeles waltl TaxID=8319 RepID=A0AAV7RJA4_PLEWA|nr:hypothetical protein NDU88_003705 [Pleurodeles waltl]